MTRQILNHQGRPITLGKELGRGGEGAVYEVNGHRDYLAKIYLKDVSPHKAQKLALMLKMGDDELKQFAAWPVSSLHNKVGGYPIGFVMRKVTKPTEIHELYSPASRKIEFPSSDWRFLVRAARNCAVAVDRMHTKQIVIGDVNQGNVLVLKNATVRLIDCDSFQIRGNGATYKCKVGVAHFTPPEVESFDAIRTPDHDNFGLAVLIFHLLFMGRHPFSGRFGGKGEMPLEKAIKENRFAYGRDATRFQMQQPPNTLALQEVTPEIASMFEAAFRDPKLQRSRPTAEQWARALKKVEGQNGECSVDSGHWHVRGVKCPWCRIAQGGGPDLFISVGFASALERRNTFNLEKVWFEIRTVKGPRESYIPLARHSPRLLRPKPIDNTADPNRALFVGTRATVIGSAVVTALSLFVPFLALFSVPMTLIFSIWWFVLWTKRPVKEEMRRRKALLKKCNADRNRATSNVSQVMQRHVRMFESAQQEFAQAKSRYEALASKQQAELKRLQAGAAEHQMNDYLSRYFINRVRIEGVGETRIVTLQSYGIETAADILEDRVLDVPGFGPVITQRLVRWRQRMEASFTFDSSKGAPSSKVQRLEMKYLQHSSRLQKALVGGAEKLTHITKAACGELRRLDKQLVEKELATSQAEVDAKVVNNNDLPP